MGHSDDPSFALIPGSVFQAGTISFAQATGDVIVSLEAPQVQREGHEPPDPIKTLCSAVRVSLALQDRSQGAGGAGDDRLSGDGGHNRSGAVGVVTTLSAAAFWL